ncbi:MAG TPA: TIGR02530 family flagellar biosynthesis protein [Solirubrobacteraceae bacterium]
MSVEVNPALLAPALQPLQPGAQTQAPARSGKGAQDGAQQVSGPSFADVLKDASTTPSGTPSQPSTAPSGSEPLHFSKHAIQRAQRRGISLDPTTLGRIKEGMGRVAGKGSRDSLVLVDGTAFVVSVANRTVITAVGSEHMREHVFTNIDSAVIA